MIHRFLTRRETRQSERESATAFGLCRIQKVGLVVIALAIASFFAFAYQKNPAHPHVGGSHGWLDWFDQSRYYVGARAWAHGDLDPKLHQYMPGYSLLGAIFIPLLSVHAFFAVDLLALLVSFLLFSLLVARLAPPGLRYPALVGGAIFAFSTCGVPPALEVWLVPWSSTGVAPFAYATLLAALRFIEMPDRAGRMFWVGLAGGAIVAFRPTDAVPLLTASALGCALALLPLSLGAFARAVGVGAAGLIGALSLVALAYLASHGLRESHYIKVESAIGFDWRLLPLRWVTLGLNPRPLFSEGEGLIAAFPWLPTGLAGFCVFLFVPPLPVRRLAHLVVITAGALHMAIYLTYRDLYPEGLFSDQNYHYYKWVLPVLLFYSIILCYGLVLAVGRRRLLAATVAGGTLVLILPWRAEFSDIGVMPRLPTSDPLHTVAFESGLSAVDDAVIIAAAGSWNAIYGGGSSLSIGGHVYTERADYKLHPTPGGLFLVPLRPLPAGFARLTVNPDITLVPKTTILHAHQTLVFGAPCWWPARVPVCKAHPVLPPPTLPADGVIPLSGAGQMFLLDGWSVPEREGRWTDGSLAQISVGLQGVIGALVLHMEFSAFAPPGAAPLRVKFSADGHVLLTQTFADGLPHVLNASIPVALVRKNSRLTISISIANPRAPSQYDVNSGDRRELGLFVRQLVLRKVPTR